ncbi:MAG TPA: glycosyltransferase [Opitutaceae bacterium]|nr:glycosyltransferase [Opitutaceae bacterium]
MKILLVQDRLRGGGTERQTAFLARAFATRGHTATVLTFRPGGTLAPELTAAGMAHHALQPFDTGLDWFAPGLAAAARATAPDIVLCMGRMANCRAARLQRALPQAAVVATVRTGKTLPWLYRRGLRAARGIIANSEFARRTLVAPEGAADRCAVIPNALLHAALLAEVANTATSPCDAAPRSGTRERFASACCAASESSGSAQSAPPILLCVAQFRREKNQRELLDIAARLPRELPWRLAFVGDGPTRVECERHAASLGLVERVVFHGWQADPARFYRGAAIAVLTSQRESLPNFLVESQCAGVPVVSYEVGGAAECFHDGETGHLIPAGDRTRFAAALAELLADPERRAAMSCAARSWARAQFDPERQVSAHLEFFERLRSR